jgi:short-subunit dehydrogenase
MIGENRMTRRGWAVVTGASGGMGAAFTRSLAKRGYSVLAVARGVEPLARLADELKKDEAVVETLAVDLASAEASTPSSTERERWATSSFSSTTRDSPRRVTFSTSPPTRSFSRSG